MCVCVCVCVVPHQEVAATKGLTTRTCFRSVQTCLNKPTKVSEPKFNSLSQDKMFLDITECIASNLSELAAKFQYQRGNFPIEFNSWSSTHSLEMKEQVAVVLRVIPPRLLGMYHKTHTLLGRALTRNNLVPLARGIGERRTA